MRTSRATLLLVALAALVARTGSVGADNVPRVVRRVVIGGSDDPAAGGRRFSRLRDHLPSRRRPTSDDTQHEEDADAAVQFNPRSRGGATIAAIDVAPVETAAEAPRRRGRARGGGGRSAGSRRRLSRLRGGASNEPAPASPAGRAPNSEPQQEAASGERQQGATTRGGQRGSGRAGSRFDLDAYLRETSRLPIADVGGAGLPGDQPEPAEPPASAAAPVSGGSSADSAASTGRRRGGASRAAVTQPGAAAPRAPGRRTSRKRVRVTPPIRRPSVPERTAPRVQQVVRPSGIAKHPDEADDRHQDTEDSAEPHQKVPALLAAFSNLTPSGESESYSPLQANGLADDPAIALPAHLPDESIGGRGGRSYLPQAGAQSLSSPSVQEVSRTRPASRPNSYLPLGDESASSEDNSYLPTSNLDDRTGNPSALARPHGSDRLSSSLFDGLALPPVDEPRSKPEPPSEPAECSADPGAIRLELRFLRPCVEDADCAANLACFSAAAPCPGAEPTESVCLPAMESGAACSRDTHCASRQCHQHVCR